MYNQKLGTYFETKFASSNANLLMPGQAKEIFESQSFKRLSIVEISK